MQLGEVTYSDICVEGRDSIIERESIPARAGEGLGDIKFDNCCMISKMDKGGEPLETTIAWSDNCFSNTGKGLGTKLVRFFLGVNRSNGGRFSGVFCRVFRINYSGFFASPGGVSLRLVVA